MTVEPGTVYLVGAGPGDPGLITVRGLNLLRRADVVVFDRLSAPELLAEARSGAELVSVGKAPGRHPLGQDRINEIIVDCASRGQTVVRLKGGDPFVFGRGAEELAACIEAGIECIVVPGVSSAIAAPAIVGIPVTLRRISRSFVVLAAQAAADQSSDSGPQDPATPPLDYRALASIDTIIIMMGRAKLAEMSERLIDAGRDPDTPAACIERATTPAQRVTRSTLAGIAAAAERDGLQSPIVTIISPTASFSDSQVPHWYRHLENGTIPLGVVGEVD